MKKADVAKVFGTALISQVVAFLNAAYQPFEGTIFVFREWQPIASKSAVAVGFVVVLVIAGLHEQSKKPITAKAIMTPAILSGVLLAMCAAIYVLLSAGFAPSSWFLFWVRDILWMLLYILMLVMVGITIARVCLSLFGGSRTQTK
jgi:hypothetical protein